MLKVSYCRDSTITEAWALIVGTPGKVSAAETGHLEISASKELGEFEPVPMFIFIEEGKDKNIVPPYWMRQLSWKNSEYSARLGHRFLSVHYLKKDGFKYETYEKSLKPQIDSWLNAYKETSEALKKRYPITKVGFGYVNTFYFPANGFILAKYLKLSFSTGSDSAKNYGLASLKISFSLNRGKPNYTIIVHIDIESTNLENVKLVTKVEAHQAVENDITFEDNLKIADLVLEAKETAKSFFFNEMATPETLRIMGAQT